MRRVWRLLPLVALTACGYFNAMYNAQRRFGDAERAEREGDPIAATRAYQDAIEKAASSYRGHPDSRWADDALLLIGRARFALGEHAAARAAFRTLLDSRPEGDMRIRAHAWLGAAEAALDNRSEAIAHLDTAIDASPEPATAALAYLWRARIHFDRGANEAAWADLEAAAGAGAHGAVDANLELAGRAIGARDTMRVRRAIEQLFGERTAARHADSVGTLVRAAAASLGPAFAWSLLEPADRSDWPTETLEPGLLMRPAFAAQAGDTVAAIRAALELADRATALTAAQARVMAAHYQLAGVDSVSALDAVRTTLLPATVASQEARLLVRTIKAVEVLLDRAAAGQPLALFVAAESVRDDLGAPQLARQLFIAYADIVPDAIWAPKALLAAAAISGPEPDPMDLVKRLLASPGNVYVQAVSADADAESFSTAEERLSRSLAVLREDAFREADARDIRVGSAVARLDSLKAIAMADSLRLACGSFIDSLAIGGVRADSVRAACIRGDTALVGVMLRVDTLQLVDTMRVRPDTGAAARRRVRPDTFAPGSR